jgi:hypothetical protein
MNHLKCQRVYLNIEKLNIKPQSKYSPFLSVLLTNQLKLFCRLFFFLRMSTCQTTDCCCCIDLRLGGFVWGKVGVFFGTLFAVVIAFQFKIPLASSEKLSLLKLSYPFMFFAINAGCSYTFHRGVRMVSCKN